MASEDETRIADLRKSAILVPPSARCQLDDNDPRRAPEGPLLSNVAGAFHYTQSARAWAAWGVPSRVPAGGAARRAAWSS